MRVVMLMNLPLKKHVRLDVLHMQVVMRMNLLLKRLVKLDLVAI